MARHSPKKLLLKQKQGYGTPFDAAAWARMIDTFGLSDTEAHLLAMILQGEPEQRIGLELGLSNPEVGDCLKSLYERVGVQSRDRLIIRVYAMLWHEEII